MELGVVSVSCGIDRVLPVLRPVCLLSHYIAPTKMVLDQHFLEQFGSVDSNSLCYLLNNNVPRNNNLDIIDVEPDVMQHSSYHDDARLSNLFEARVDVFIILSLNCQSLNAKIDQINIKLQQLKSNGHEFDEFCCCQRCYSIPCIKGTRHT